MENIPRPTRRRGLRLAFFRSLFASSQSSNSSRKTRPLSLAKAVNRLAVASEMRAFSVFVQNRSGPFHFFDRFKIFERLEVTSLRKLTTGSNAMDSELLV